MPQNATPPTTAVLKNSELRIQTELAQSRVGHWHLLMHKESREPLMYLDASLQKHLAIEEELSPNGVFHYWYDRVLEQERPYIQKAIIEVLSHPNTQYEMDYLWHHPIIGIMPVRILFKSFIPSVAGYDGIGGSLVLLNDVQSMESALRQSNINIENMFNASPLAIGIWTLDAELFTSQASNANARENFNLTLMDCNPKLLEFYGIDNKEAFKGKFHKFSPEMQPCGAHSSEKAFAAVQRTFEKGHHSFEWMHCNAHGDPLPCEITMIRTYTQGQEAFISYIRDLSVEKRIIKNLAEHQVELQEALLAADEARQSKNLFFANISHEIRTPMNAILGMSHLCLQHTQDPAICHYLENIRKAGESLLHIINDVLDLSKIEAGKLELEEAPFSLTDILDNISTTCCTLTHNKPIEILFNVDPTLPAQFLGDGVRLGQVLTNLFSNAVKFTQKGHIALRVYKKAQHGTIYTLGMDVSDTGIGMNEERLAAIFRPFEQAEHTITRRFGGTGLGLTISKNIVEQMGGKISVQSTEGLGTTFSFDVSLAAHKDNQWLDVSLVKKESILILDDMPMSRQTLEEMLSYCGFNIKTAATIEEACTLLQEAQNLGTPISLAIIDWKMPHITGYEAAQRMQALGLKQCPPMLLTSAYSRSILTDDWKNLFVGFLPKPILPMPLWATIMHALHIPIDGVQELTHTEDQKRYQELAGRSVLLTEDNEINQEIAIALLEDLGLSIQLADNGQQALELCQLTHFDIVLMDIQMPIMDGLTATKHIRKLPGYEPENIPIIAMTAHAMQMHREQSFEAGMNDHLTKPIDPKVLRNMLYQWIVNKK